jgi:hypothetical protein
MARYSRARSRFGTFTAVSFPFPTSVMLAPRLFRHSHGYILHPSEGWSVFALFCAGKVGRPGEACKLSLAAFERNLGSALNFAVTANHLSTFP